MNLKENYERMFGKMAKFDKLGLKKKLNEGYFDKYQEPYGIMVSLRDAQLANEKINDDRYLKDQQPRSRGTNVFLFKSGDDLMDALSRFNSANIEIEKLRIDGQEIDYDEDTFDPSDFDLE